ncbi:hypothetical protein GCM10010273_02410 [Streptomyces lavendulocolor]
MPAAKTISKLRRQKATAASSRFVRFVRADDAMGTPPPPIGEPIVEKRARARQGACDAHTGTARAGHGAAPAEGPVGDTAGAAVFRTPLYGTSEGPEPPGPCGPAGSRHPDSTAPAPAPVPREPRPDGGAPGPWRGPVRGRPAGHLARWRTGGLPARCARPREPCRPGRLAGVPAAAARPAGRQTVSARSVGRIGAGSSLAPVR